MSCLHWWIINRGYWSPWQNDCIEHNLVKNKKGFRSGRMCKRPSRLRFCCIWEAEVAPWTSSQANLLRSSIIWMNWEHPLGPSADNFGDILWRRQWRAFYRRPVLYCPSMCTGGCAKCLGGALIPLTVFGFLANILLFFPGGKVIDHNECLSEEVWFFGGILGSGVLVNRNALKSL